MPVEKKQFSRKFLWLRKKVFVGFCWGITLWLGGMGWVEAAVLLELKEQAVQNTTVLPLGEVATISGAAALQKGLRDIVLPGKGKVGDTVTYTRDEITQQIGRQHPDWAPLLRWSGAQRVLVQRRGVMVAAQEYIGWAREYLLAHWATKSGHFLLQPINEYRPLIIPDGTRSISARFTDDTVRRTSKVWLDIAVDGRPYSSAAVIFDVRWLDSAWVLKQRGSARQNLGEAMLSNTEVDVSLTNGALLKDVRQLIGKRLRHDVEAGVALGAGDLEDKPAIEQGAVVQVFTKVGRVLVRTQAVAQRDGYIGQRIAVKNAQTNEQLTVEVIGENRAVVSDSQQR